MKESLTHLGLYRFDIPFRSSAHVAGKNLTRRQGLLLSLTAGPETRWGEISPLPGYSQETLSEAQAQTLEFLKSDSLDLLSNDDSLSELLPSVAFGVSCAFFPLTPIAKNVSVARLLMGTQRDILDQAIELKRHALPTAIKIKIGQNSPSQEASLVWELSEILNGLPLRLDVNRQWDLAHALEFSQAVRGCPIAFIEEPVKIFHDLGVFRQESNLPLALDESLRLGHQKALSVAATHWILKPSILGSLSHLRGWISLAEKNAIQPVLSSLYEWDVGTFHILNLANLVSSPIALGLDPYLTYLGHSLPNQAKSPDLSHLALLFETTRALPRVSTPVIK